MGMTILRPEKQLYISDVQVLRPRKINATATWWDNNGAISGCVAAYGAKGAADLAASYINLANPGTYNAAPGVAPTLDADGWVFNGTTQYLNSGVVASVNNVWSILIRFDNATTSPAVVNYVIAAADTTGGIIGLSPRPLGNKQVYANGGILQVGSAPLNSGVMGVAGQTAYLNGSSAGTISSASSTPSYPFFIGCRNQLGGAIHFFAGSVQALAIYSTTLSAGDVATITTAMQAL